MGLSAAEMTAIQRRIDMSERRIMNRLRLLATRGVLSSVDDETGVQNVKVTLLGTEVRDKVERFQRFGFSSNPPKGSECLAIAVGGNRDHLIVIAEDDRGSRISDTASGESVQYGEDGQTITCKTGGGIECVPTLAGVVNLGAAAPAEFVALATKTQIEIAKVATLLTTWTVAGGDGGAALKLAAVALWPLGGASVPAPAATKVKGV